jgi:uncharacterized surface protein with fasciclin (FAS1) repeats
MSISVSILVTTVLALLPIAGSRVLAQERPAAHAGAPSAAAAERDIVDVAAAAGKFNTLVAAVKAAGLVDALQAKGPFTVFAPTDEAFAKLPKGTVESLLDPKNKSKLVSILTYHVVPAKLAASDVARTTGAATLQGQRLAFKVDGDRVAVDGASVVMADVKASNGVIHVIDQVILPTDKNAVEVGMADGRFGTLLAAAKAAGLADALATGGPFTIFAPTDEAFAKLPKGTVENLLKPENKAKLADILKLHIVSGRVDSTAAKAANQAVSMQGGTLELSVKDGGLSVNGARIVNADVNASNAIIHVIDTVILPR